MKDITCPKCGTKFQVDDTTYAAILNQVRNSEFTREIERRAKEMHLQAEANEKALRLEVEKTFGQRIGEKEREVQSLKTEIERYKGEISGYDAKKQLELAQLESVVTEKRRNELAAKEKEITDLRTELAAKDSQYTLKLVQEQASMQSSLQQKDNEITELRNSLQSAKLIAENRESQLREQHQILLQNKQDEIDRLKDFKMRLSTKMVGESLEQHCALLFEKAQSDGLYPDASFEKDNTAVEHSKGDFIFRDFVDGEEYVSVMFEMKNESDESANKHRNDDFLDKLDKDRNRKKCEYAVLVSMLEQGNELYDRGIVDKSHRYPRMLVIRPQFFLPVLRLLTETSKKGFKEKRALVKELETARSHTADFSRFEENINKFRDAFNKNVAAAHSKFTSACEGIDKTIEALEKQIVKLREIKASFEASEQRLLKADEIAEERLTVKKLTYGAPSVRKMIEKAARDNE